MSKLEIIKAAAWGILGANVVITILILDGFMWEKILNWLLP